MSSNLNFSRKFTQDYNYGGRRYLLHVRLSIFLYLFFKKEFNFFLE